MATTNPLTADASTVLLYHMDGAAASAGKKADSSANALNLTETGTPTAATGQITPTASGAYACSAGTNFIQLTSNSVLNVSNITIEGWFSTASSNCGFFHRYVGVGNRMFRAIITAGGKLGVIFYNNTDANFSEVDSTTTINTGAFFYFAITYDGSNVNIYINPSSSTPEVTSAQANTLASATANFVIGSSNPVEAGNPTVTVDEFRYSSTARSGVSIYNYYNNIVQAGNYMTLGVGT